MPDQSERLIEQMAALGQESRFRVFQYLMKAGPDGVSAGQLASALNILPSTLSTHLAVLSRAGLVTCLREGRTLLYSAHLDGVRGMLEGVVADCCNGHPELCRSLKESASPECAS